MRPPDPAARHHPRHRHHHRGDPVRPRHRRQPGQRDLPALRGPPRLGLPALRGDLPGRHLPAHPRRARRRQRHPRVGRDPSVRVRHLHRTLLRPGPHPRRHPRREGGPLPTPAQGELLPARAADLLRPAAQGRRRLPGTAAVPGLLRLQRLRGLERPLRRAVAAHRHRHPPPGRQARQAARRPGPGLVRQGGRVPAPRPDPLPRHLPPRRHRPPPPRAHHPAAARDHRRRAGRRHPGRRQLGLVRHRPPPGQAEEAGTSPGAPRSTPASSASPTTARSPTSRSPRTWPSTPPSPPSRSASRPAGSPPTTPAPTPTRAPTRDG